MNIQKVPVTQIVLDERNPRVAHIMDNMGDGNPQDLIPLALGQYAPENEEGGSSTTYSSLKASIRAHGGLIVPVIVTPRGDGTYTVIEGNTRVQIFRELEEEGSPGDWSMIPADVQSSLNEAGEHAIRLQAHLVGPRQWRPYAKARYLHELYIKHNKSITEIIEFCGGSARRKEIERYIEAYKDMQKHYLPLVHAESSRPDYSCFSSFVELQAIKPSLALTEYTEADFAKWVHKGRMSPQQLVRQLPRILANPEAKRQFFAHDAREAVKVLDQPNPNAMLATASLEQLATALAVKLRQIQYQDIRSMRHSPDQPSAQALLSCYDELKMVVEEFGQTDRG
ncbi:ParB N-terminal domain-containing protein [Roseomonas mucosa]|uniref:ParB N-terminal domain-containing protein n=1 Tax=Roseomonas mucosa TaxID=207340 RepID=UPI00224657EA|nr:ParB N-terminal domain-containing protein [Roseomonas mucosa]UZO94773.1 Hypothetical protein RMP42_05861 [Roseomonas mucosa]